MKKILNTAAALIAALCLAVGALSLSACSSNYTVNIQYEDGRGVAGVTVTIAPQDGAAYESNAELDAVTNENGAAVFDISAWSDTTTLLIVIDGKDVPENYSIPSRSLAKISDGCMFNLTAARLTFENINVNLSGTELTQEYEPASYLEDGYYEFKTSDPDVSFTLTDGYDINVTEGSNSIYVNYKRGDIYDIGTANNNTSFSLVFIKLDKTADTAENGLEIASERIMAFNLEAGETVYLYNPYELDVAESQSSGAPQMITGSNFKATVDSTDYTDGFKVGSNKSIKITTADGSAGTVVLYIKAISNTHTIAVGESKNVEIGLLERSLKTQKNANPSPVLLWESNLRFTFTVDTVGTYKFTITSVNVTSDLLSIDTIKSTGAIPVLPETKKGDEGNPFEVTFVVTANNLNYATDYTIDFVTAVNDYANNEYKQGDKLTYTVTFEKIS